jgi:pilus assembly protein FimV
VPNEEEVKETIWHEVATKIDLAKAYQAMGEVAGMREILAEVMLEGDHAQRVIAQNMLKAMD